MGDAHRTIARVVRDLADAFIELAGFGALVAAAWMVSVPAGLAAAGVAAIIVANRR